MEETSKTQLHKQQNKKILEFMGYVYLSNTDEKYVPFKGSNAGYWVLRTTLLTGLITPEDILYKTNGTVPFNQDWNLLHKVINFIDKAEILRSLPGLKRVQARNFIQNAMWEDRRFDAYNTILKVIDLYEQRQADMVAQIRRDIKRETDNPTEV